MNAIDPRLNRIRDCLYRLTAKAIIVHNGRLLMVHERAGYLGLPGGGIEHDDSLQDTIIRELNEEIGITKDNIATISDVMRINFGSVENGIPRAHLYCTVLLKDYNKLQKREVDYQWVEADRLVRADISSTLHSQIAFLREQLEN